MIDTGNWRKSSYSSGNSDNCVEVASDGGVLIRDTTDRSGATLNVTAGAWLTFTSSIK
jgi:Domain of unknown function (DUF397)